MRLLQLNPNGNEATALDLHPMVTVVTDLSASGRDRLFRAATALPQGGDPGSPGLIEAHGILLDLSPDILRVLDLVMEAPSPDRGTADQKTRSSSARTKPVHPQGGRDFRPRADAPEALRSAPSIHCYGGDPE